MMCHDVYGRYVAYIEVYEVFEFRLFSHHGVFYEERDEKRESVQTTRREPPIELQLNI